jgi:hypothetical protein
MVPPDTRAVPYFTDAVRANGAAPVWMAALDGDIAKLVLLGSHDGEVM